MVVAAGKARGHAEAARWLEEKLESPRASANGKTHVVAEYEYRAENRELLSVVERYKPKRFTQKVPDGKGGWIYRLDGVRRVPYRLPELREAIANGETIFVVEGEKDAEALAARGLCTTTGAQGAAWKWPATWAAFFKGAKRVVVLPDCDDAGRKAARQRASIVATVCEDVCILDLAPGRTNGYDVSDWLGEKHTCDELVMLAAGATRLSSTEPSIHPDRLDIVRLVDVIPEQVEWIWPSRIPRSKVTLLVGDPGAGKSFASLAISSAETNGTALPGDEAPRTPSNVLMWNGEDGIEDTIRVRAEALDVDLSRMHVIRGGLDEAGRRRPFSLADVGRLHFEIQRLGDVRMVVIDPVSVLLAGVDTHVDAEVRSTLQPLVELARDARVAVVVVLHLKKGEAERIVYRIGGSIGFVALARSVLLVAADEDGRRAIAPVKSNLCAAPRPVEFRIDDEGRWWWGTLNDDLSAEHLLCVRRERGSALREAIEFFEQALTNGDRDVSEVAAEAEAAGISRKTQERARKKLGIKSRRVGGIGEDGKWVLSNSKGANAAKNAIITPGVDSGLRVDVEPNVGAAAEVIDVW